LTVAELISWVLLALGCFVALTAAVGIHRMPDFFSRIHPAGKTDTLAQMLILLALAVQAGFSPPSLKLLLISVFLLLTSPSSTHAIAQAAHLEGLEPWTKPPQEPPADTREEAAQR